MRVRKIKSFYILGYLLETYHKNIAIWFFFGVENLELFSMKNYLFRLKSYFPSRNLVKFRQQNKHSSAYTHNKLIFILFTKRTILTWMPKSLSNWGLWGLFVRLMTPPPFSTMARIYELFYSGSILLGLTFIFPRKSTIFTPNFQVSTSGQTGVDISNSVLACSAIQVLQQNCLVSPGPPFRKHRLTFPLIICCLHNVSKSTSLFIWNLSGLRQSLIRSCSP
jgi:hypothetical protein